MTQAIKEIKTIRMTLTKKIETFILVPYLKEVGRVAVKVLAPKQNQQKK